MAAAKLIAANSPGASGPLTACQIAPTAFRLTRCVR